MWLCHTRVHERRKLTAEPHIGGHKTADKQFALLWYDLHMALAYRTGCVELESSSGCDDPCESV